MAKKRRLTEGSSAMQLECCNNMTAGSSATQLEGCNDMILEILSRVPLRDVPKMSRVDKRWRSLILNPFFADAHYKNCHRESMFLFLEYFRRSMGETFQFRSYNPQTGNLFIVPFSWEGFDSSFLNTKLKLVTASEGLMCLFLSEPMHIPVFCMYNPVTKFLKKLSVPIEVDANMILFSKICCTQNTLKFVIAGFSVADKSPYTLVFNSQSNSWYKGRPLLHFTDVSVFNRVGTPLFFNGIIYIVAKGKTLDAQELNEPIETLFRDEEDFLYRIIGYDVNQDRWSFSIFIPASVGFPYCITEWEGNLLVCASNSTHDGSNQRIRYSLDEGDGHFMFWKLNTKHKLWTEERELDLSDIFHTFWKVSASNGLVWFTCGYNYVTVYHMKNRHRSTHRLDDALAWQQEKTIECVCFEPTILSF